MDKRNCPKCQAEGVTVEVVILDGYGVCSRCDTTWNLGKLGQMIAVPEEI